MYKDRYFMAPIEVFDEDQHLLSSTAALVSSSCVFRVMHDCEFARKSFLQRKLLIVRINKYCLLYGRLIREVGRDGVHYHLRIMQSRGDQKDQLGLYLVHQGFGNPWKRVLPRIPVAPLSQRLEIPLKVYLPRVARETPAKVINFSYYGMFIEFGCSGLSLTEQVGQILVLRMVTSSRLSLTGIRARVVNIYDETMGRGKILRGLGMSFVFMRKEVRRKYNEMILDVCHSFKNEN